MKFKKRLYVKNMRKLGDCMISIDKDLIKNIVSNGKRLDNREFNQYRDIIIETNIIPQAEGSARVKLGDTEVIAGVKLDIGEPFPDTGDEGMLMVGAEFVPLASEEFEPGPPNESSIELARVVDRAIRESKCIDLKKLCIKENEKVWCIFVDIDVLDHDGNLIDAATLAATAALLNTKMLKLEKDGENYKVNYEQKTDEPLPMTKKPVNTTFVKIGDAILADPSVQEEDAMDARLTVGTFEENGETKFCSMQKGGNDGFTLEEIEKILDLAEEKGKELRKLLNF